MQVREQKLLFGRKILMSIREVLVLVQEVLVLKTLLKNSAVKKLMLLNGQKIRKSLSKKHFRLQRLLMLKSLMNKIKLAEYQFPTINCHLLLVIVDKMQDLRLCSQVGK